MIYAVILMMGIIYPASYDLLQFYRGGVAEYFSDIYNYADMLYIYGSLANSILQTPNMFENGCKKQHMA